ncbi:MAG: glycosyl transferase [Nitrosomonas sp.]|nr:MAG: glycosyl transferase [Nitrosomonas sp.]
MSSGSAGYGKVTVLLSTHNGSIFLREQLDSLYQQTYPNVRILVRDDGSIDSTRNLLEEEHVKGRIALLQGHSNLGAASSFFELLKNAAANKAEYVAFCDQDDVWDPEKVARAALRLAAVPSDHPAMYCSRVEVVDERLAHIGYTMPPRKIGFGNALVECVTTGCTIVLNRAAVRLLGKNLPISGVMHDWWCYLVVSCFGEIIYDSTATLKYRQHGNNAIGLAGNIYIQFFRRCHRFFGGCGGHLRMSTQASRFLSIFKDRVPVSNRQILVDFIAAKSSWYRRLQLALSSDIWRQKWSDNLLLRLLILINRY